MHEFDPAKFLSNSWISIASIFKKDVKLDLSIDIDKLLMVEKSITGGIYHSFYSYGKANNLKDYDKNKESSYSQNSNVNNSYGWAKNTDTYE